MIRTAILATMLSLSIAPQAVARPTKQRAMDQRNCTPDGLIHAEVSSAISQKVNAMITLLEPGARVREATKLDLPCGFHIDPRYGWSLVLSNGTQVRRYLENNAFGFAPAYGFGEQPTKSYTLNYRLAPAGDLTADSCAGRLKGMAGAPRLCTSFGSETSFFGAKPDRRGTRLAHYGRRGATFKEDFAVANVDGQVRSIAFLPPPDAPGGTLTLILSADGDIYRVYLDTPKG